MHNNNSVVCAECNSINVHEVSQTEGILRCDDCGAFFEDYEFELDLIRKTREHRQIRQMLGT